MATLLRRAIQAVRPAECQPEREGRRRWYCGPIGTIIFYYISRRPHFVSDVLIARFSRFFFSCSLCVICFCVGGRLPHFQWHGVKEEAHTSFTIEMILDGGIKGKKTEWEMTTATITDRGRAKREKASENREPEKKKKQKLSEHRRTKKNQQVVALLFTECPHCVGQCADICGSHARFVFESRIDCCCSKFSLCRAYQQARIEPQARMHVY